MTEKYEAAASLGVFDRAETAVWMRKSLGLYVDFEDWDELTDDEVRDLVFRMYGVEIDDVVEAMEANREV